MRLKSLFTAGVLAALGAAYAGAQSPNALEFNVPCAFTINDTLMPAGEYSISRFGLGNTLFAIRSNETGRTVLFAGNAVERASAPVRSSLVFGRDRGDYFLEDIWWAGYTSGVQLPIMKTVNELSLAAGLRSPEVVVIRHR